MPALLLTAALATGQPAAETIRPIDSGAWAQVKVVQDLTAVVSGVAPFAQSIQGAHIATGLGSVTLRQTGAGIVSTTVDAGLNSATQAATVVSARIAMPDLTPVASR